MAQRASDPARYVYVVDHSEAVRDALRALFEAHGFIVREFASGAEFLKAYAPRMQGCTLLALDQEASALEALRSLATIAGGDLPVVVMNNGSRTARRSAIEAGAWDVIDKPFAGEQIVAAVKGALRLVC